MALQGSEQTFIRKRHTRTTGSGKNRRTHTYYTNHWGKTSVCNIQYVIQQLPDGVAPAGQYTFPFSVQIPPWLPASMLLSTQRECALMAITYELVAEFKPFDESGYETS